jgi:hypothetical protein
MKYAISFGYNELYSMYCGALQNILYLLNEVE